MSRSLGIVLLAVALVVVPWGAGDAQPPSPAIRTAPAPTEPPFHDILKKSASEYRTYGRFDDEMRWAPFYCRMPMPGVAYVSASKDDKTHGQKLYSLFVKD